MRKSVAKSTGEKRDIAGKSASKKDSQQDMAQNVTSDASHTLFVEITPEKYFVLCDGRQVKNYKELADILRLIKDDVFFYHVTDQKNDFSNWINDVFKEEDLAKKIHNMHNKLEMSLELYKHLFERLEKLSQKTA